ncbi:MAG: acid sphingomyelinase phosphodiesterase [marine bacterium B5-7]|nr:MAG: acid sphingomyelinase phosphodiesterase [marine bacterium B5-7]
MKKPLFIAALLASATTFAAAPANFIALSDTHFSHTTQSTDYGKDTGNLLWQHALTKIHQLRENHSLGSKSPKFMLLLGDLPAHHTSVEEHNTNSQTVLQDLRGAVDGLPVFYVPGNNDSLGGNYHSFTDADGNTPFSLDSKQGWPALNAKASCVDAAHEACFYHSPYNLRYGNYAAYPMGTEAHLRLIAMNSVVFSNSGKHPYAADDGTEQAKAAQLTLDWLQNELRDAQMKGDKVYLAMHVPPGEDAFSAGDMWKPLQYDNNHTDQQQFLDEIDAYKSIVAGVFFSHTHYDELRKLHSSHGDVSTVAFSVPGLTPQHYNNPAFKLFSFAPSTGELLDSVTMYTEPKKADFGGDYYVFSAEYGCNASMVACVLGLPQAKLNQVMNKDYLVRSNASDEKWDQVDETIDVQYKR